MKIITIVRITKTLYGTSLLKNKIQINNFTLFKLLKNNLFNLYLPKIIFERTVWWSLISK